jgi:hypothetical protein
VSATRDLVVSAGSDGPDLVGRGMGEIYGAGAPEGQRLVTQPPCVIAILCEKNADSHFPTTAGGVYVSCMTPNEFIAKWSASERRERAHAQEHFIDLCRLLGEKTPGEGSEDSYTFEKGASILGGGNGWADVWKRGCFAWEYKSGGKDLDQALVQLKRYSDVVDGARCRHRGAIG